MMKNTKELRRDVVEETSRTVKMLTGKWVNYQDNTKLDALVDDLISHVPSGGSEHTLNVSGFINYVFDIRKPNFHYSSLFHPGLVEKYRIYCSDQSSTIRARVNHMIETFDVKRTYLTLQELLHPPRHDMDSVVRWCLARRHKIEVENPNELHDTVVFDLRCHPWYYDCIGTLPELEYMKDRPFVKTAYKLRAKIIKRKGDM